MTVERGYAVAAELPGMTVERGYAVAAELPGMTVEGMTV